MIIRMRREDRRRVRFLTRRQWRRCFVPIAILDVTGFGRVLIVCRSLDTRWSDREHRRLWRLPVTTRDQQQPSSAIPESTNAQVKRGY